MLKSVKWYEEKQKDLGIRFLEAVERKMKSIISNPLLYQIRYKNTRLALTKTFPYAIHFTIEGDKVVVLAVLGTKEDPEKWYS